MEVDGACHDGTSGHMHINIHVEKKKEKYEIKRRRKWFESPLNAVRLGIILPVPNMKETSRVCLSCLILTNAPLEGEPI